MQDAKVLSFSEPNLALQFLTDNPSFHPKIKCIIVDYYFDNICKDINQLNFVESIRKISVLTPIFVSTNGIF